jgi:hydrogenase-4 transcriptional activator
MDRFEQARSLLDSGQYREALEALGGLDNVVHARSLHAALRADLLERVGRLDDALRVAQTALRGREISLSDRSSCESIIGRVLIEQSETISATEHLRKSTSLARQSKDSCQLFWSLLYQVMLVGQQSGPDAARPIVAELRSLATKLGDRRITAALHIFVGELEAKRGLFENASHHLAIGTRLLRAAHDCWLEAFAENVLLAIGILKSDFKWALGHGERALKAAERSGAAKMIRATIGNMGTLWYALGDAERAIECHARADQAMSTAGHPSNAQLDSLVRIALTQGKLEECESYLERIDKSIKLPRDRYLSSNRVAQLTKAVVFGRLGRQDALSEAELALNLAKDVGDAYVALGASLTCAEILQQSGRTLEAVDTLTALVPDLSGQSPDLYAQSERILACASASQGNSDAAEFHYRRARRIYIATSFSPGLIELERCWRDAHFSGSDVATAASEYELQRAGLHSVAAILLHSNRPEFVGSEIVALLDSAACVQHALAISRAPDGVETTLAQVGTPAQSETESATTRRLPIGFSDGHAIEVIASVKPDVESVATVNALALLLSSIHELERARLEREERATLWPAEELPLNGQRWVVTGNMREQMDLARRVASTNVNILITGQSGTGKDILARALHDFSDRAQKPFVAFNCSAIPRDLLESQLFGHRRGSFTGADRDHPGVIRSARDGTLFLDEVGDLSLELQPKLLRFLESGEIAPLGEHTQTVSVRIVAATNNNLEDAVQAGRFREDLFYRLNVIRLSLKPLRERRDEIPGLVRHFVERAAEEFGKGILRIPDETMEQLTLYRWPGNVRQLQNEVRRMVAIAEPGAALRSDTISHEILAMLPPYQSALNGRHIEVSLEDKLQPTLARIECEMIKAALAQHRGRVNAVAKSLGISRKGLYLKRQRLGL